MPGGSAFKPDTLPLLPTPPPASPALEPTPAAGAQVMGGALEGSNVNVVRTMVDMIETLRRYEAAQRATQAADEAARYAANDMGRV